MPNAQVVGRIAVKVLPDTSGFRKKLKTDLDAIEKSLDGIKVKLNLDSEGVAQQAKAVAKKVQAELDSITLKINDESSKSVEKALARVNAEIEKLDEIDLKVELDRSSLEAAKALLKDQLDKVSAVDLKVDKSSASSLQAAIAKLDAEIAKAAEVDLKVKLDSGSLASARAALAAELDKVATLDLKIDSRTGGSIEKSIAAIDAELAKISKVDLKVKLDRPSLEAAKAKLSQDLARAARLKVTMDNVAFRAMQDKIRKELQGIEFSPTLHEDPKAMDKLRRDIAKTLEQIHDLEATITPQMSERDKHAVLDDIKDLKDKLDDLKKTEIKPNMNGGAKRIVVGELAVLARSREVSLIPKVNKAAATKAATVLAAFSGARVVNDMVKNLVESLGRLDKNVPIIGTIAEAIAGLAAWALSAASNLFSLSASLAQIAGASFALPGIFGGLAIGIGASIAVLKDFNKVLPNVKTQLSKLQDQMSEKFWKVAKAPIQDLVNHLLPELSKGLQGTSTNLGKFFGSLATALKTSFDGALTGMFKDLNDSIEIAGGAVGSLASIITTLGQVGAGYLPKLAAWFVLIAQKFDGFITNAAADGRLQQWIDDGVFALQELGRVAAGAGKILKGIADAAAAAGGSTLTSLADVLDRIATTVNSPGFQKSLTGVFVAAHTAMDNLSNGAGPGLEKLFTSLAKTAQTVFPLVGKTIGMAIGGIASALASPAVQKGITDLFGGLSKGIAGILPYLPKVGSALGALGSIVGTLASNLGPSIGAALGGLAGIVTTLAPKLQPIIDILGKGLTGVIQQLAPALQTIAGAIANLITPEVVGQIKAFIAEGLIGLSQYLPGLTQAFVGLIEAIQPLIPQLLNFATTVFPQLIQGSTDLINGLLPTIDVFGKLVAAVAPVIGLLTPLVTFLLGPILQAVNAPFVALGNLITQVPPLWEKLKSSAISAWTAVTSFISTAVSAVRSVVSSAFSSVVSTVQSKFASAKAAVSSAWAAVVGFTTTAMSKLGSAVKGGIQTAIGFLKSLPSQARSALGNLGGTLIAAGKSLIDGFVSGITSKISAVQGVLQGITSKLPDWKGPAKKDATILKPAGQKVVNGFVVGIKQQIPVLRAALQSLTDALPSMVKTNIGKVNSVIGSMSKVLTASQKAHLNTLVTQAQAGVAAVEKAQSVLATKVKNAQKNLDDLRKASADYTKNVFDKLVSPGDVTGGDDHSFKAIIANLTDAKNKAIEFRGVLDKLTKAGLSKQALDQIAQAGPDAGLAAAKSILAAGKSGVKQVNDLQAQLAQAANKAAQQAAASQYANGINIAQGLLNGLKAMQKPLDAQMTRLADVLVAAVKKALKIHSPSRVFMKLGGYVGQGFALGIDNERANVQSSLSSMADHRAVGAQLSGAVTSALAGDGAAGGGKTLIYNAAPGRSISSEEDLFAAADRSRMVF